MRLGCGSTSIVEAKEDNAVDSDSDSDSDDDE
jgi:hypothetical protein